MNFKQFRFNHPVLLRLAHSAWWVGLAFSIICSTVETPDLDEIKVDFHGVITRIPNTKFVRTQIPNIINNMRRNKLKFMFLVNYFYTPYQGMKNRLSVILSAVHQVLLRMSMFGIWESINLSFDIRAILLSLCCFN